MHITTTAGSELAVVHTATAGYTVVAAWMNRRGDPDLKIDDFDFAQLTRGPSVSSRPGVERGSFS